MLVVCNAGKPKPRAPHPRAAVRKCPGPVPDWEHLKSLLREARATTCYWRLHTYDQLQRHHDSRDIIREAHCAPELPTESPLRPTGQPQPPQCPNSSARYIPQLLPTPNNPLTHLRPVSPTRAHGTSSTPAATPARSAAWPSPRRWRPQSSSS